MSLPEFGPQNIEAEYVEQMRHVGRAIDEVFNDPSQKSTTGYVLMVFPFGPEGSAGRTNYISNARRRDVLRLLEEQTAKFRFDLRDGSEPEVEFIRLVVPQKLADRFKGRAAYLGKTVQDRILQLMRQDTNNSPRVRRKK